MALDYLKIQGDVLVSHGADAAILLALITFRSYDAEGWVGTYADIEYDTGLTPRRIRTAAALLRDTGLLETASAGGGRTLRWWAKVQNVTTKRSERHLDTVYRETNTTNTAGAGIEEPVMHDAEVTPIDGGLFPSEAVDRRDPTADEWANECRKIWRERFTAAMGHEPHPDTASKAHGHIKRACSRSVTQDHFRDVWRAARDAGSEGRFNVQVDKPLPASRPAQQNPLSVMVAASFAAGAYDHLTPNQTREIGQ